MKIIQDYQSEIDYWDKELSLTGVYPEAIINRSTPGLMIKEYPNVFEKYRKRFSKIPKVLDVGSGPLSMLAYGQNNNLISLTCVDPLGKVYMNLLKKYNFQNEYEIIDSPGELISKKFRKSSFDIVWIHNALDHSFSPKQTVIEAEKVLATNGYLMILGWSKEGTAEGFNGLHQNDLFINKGRLWCSNKEGNSEQIDNISTLQVDNVEIENSRRE